MKILVTGGAGFIGSHICEKLLNLGYSVNCVDNLSNGKMENIENLLEHPKFRFFQKDVLELSEHDTEMDVDAICHQAAIGSVPKSILHPDLYQKNNIDAFFHLLEIARIKNIKRFVYASSSSVYGDNSKLPKKEKYIGNALSPYAATKQINEIQAKTYNIVYQLETIGLRYFNVFGPKQNPYGDYAAVVPKFVMEMLNNQSPTINGDGSYGRDFTYIDNVVQANILALTTKNTKCFGESFNIAFGELTTIKQLFLLIKSIIKSDIEVLHRDFRKGDIPVSVADVSKAKKLLKYKPEINIHEGLENLVKFLKTKKS